MRSFLTFLLVTLALAAVPAHAATTSRVYTSVPQSFSINGDDCPEVTSWSGGDLSGTVVENVANGAVTKKHIGQVGYEPIVVKAVAPLSPGLSACLADLCAGRSTPVTLDLSGSDPIPLQATNAQLMEAQFAALDGSSKANYEIIFIFRATSVQPHAGPAKPSVKVGKSSQALAANFHLTLGSLDTSRVVSIEPFTVTRATGTDPVGISRFSSAQTGPTKFPNLVVVTDDASVESWMMWRDDFLARDNNADDKELEGSLTLLGSDLRTPLLSLQISHIGILRLAHNPHPADSMVRSTATLYCEQITLAQPGTNPAPAPNTNPTPSTTTPPKDTTNPNDAGLRDPAGFPRPAGLTRTTYSKSDSDSRLSETAGYSSDQTVTALLEAYVKAIAADGWKKDSINESGNTPADQMIMSYWHKDKSKADLRLYAAKKGCTVSLSITTDK